MSIKILVGADIVPTKSNIDAFISGDIIDIVDERILQTFRNADCRILNLEVPLTDNEEPISKYGPNLIAPTAAIKGYQALGVDFFTLANNHIMDQGEQGLWSTVHTLDVAGISYAGVGQTSDDAAKPFVFELDDKKIGIYCCAEHEFSIVSNKKAGANPFDPLESLDHIEQLSRECDFVICLYHGGKEHYRYPSPNLQKVCRKIAEKGADLVVCQHSHCIGCEEIWKGSTIVYGQGNFLFDRSESEYWKTGLVISIEIQDKLNIEYIPIVKALNGVRSADKNESDEILVEYKKRSKLIQEPGFVESQYEKFATSVITSYMTSTDMFRNLLIFRIVNKVLAGRLDRILANKKISKFKERLINQYECEAHRELILKGLKINK